MFSFGKSKRVANLIIDDYAIRLVENNGEDLTSIEIVEEREIPEQTIQDGKIVDDLAFYDFMKEVVDEWDIRRRQVRFHVPHALVIMRDIDLPDNVKRDEIKQYIIMEIGHTIHFPFKDPVFDIYGEPDSETVEQVTVLAAPEEEIVKYMEIFSDVQLTPIAVDVQPLSIYRYFIEQEHAISKDDVYFFVELNLTSMNISIFNNHHLEFLRYQPLTVSANHWELHNGRWTFNGDETALLGEISDQLTEIERLQSFYQFSIHQGEKAVSHIILCGDYPNLQDIEEQLDQLYPLPIQRLTTDLVTDEAIDHSFVPALGLALKGGT